MTAAVLAEYRALGNASAPRQRGAEAPAEYLFPWLPPVDDWSRLLESLLQFPVPQWIVVRIPTGADAGEAVADLSSAVQDCEQFLAGDGQDHITFRRQIELLRESCVMRIAQLLGSALRAARSIPIMQCWVYIPPLSTKTGRFLESFRSERIRRGTFSGANSSADSMFNERRRRPRAARTLLLPSTHLNSRALGVSRQITSSFFSANVSIGARFAWFCCVAYR